MNKELMDILDKEAYLFNEELWERFMDHFGINDLEELDTLKFDDAMLYIKEVNEKIYQWEDDVQLADKYGD